MTNVIAPKNVFLLGNKALLKTTIAKFKAKKVKEWRAHFPLYEFSDSGQKFGLSPYYYGSGAAAACLEDLIGAGSENFIFLSFARPVDDSIKAGSIILPTRAVRDEGASFHYLKPAKQVIGNVDIEKKLKEILKEESLNSKLGLTWSTDAPYKKVRKTKEIIDSGAFVIDNETSALFAVARYRDVYLGGVLIVNEQTIGGKIREKIKDPLKGLKNHVAGLCVKVLASKILWKSLRDEKEERKKPAPVKKTKPLPKIEVKKLDAPVIEETTVVAESVESIAPVEPTRFAMWEDRVNFLSKQINTLANTPAVQGKEENVLEGLLVKKELFVSEYHKTQSKYVRGKIDFYGYNRISLSCIKILEKILEEVKELIKPGDQSDIVLTRIGGSFSDSDEVVEEIYSQLNEGESLDFYREEEAPPEAKPHKNRFAVFLVNLPRRFRYRPYYKKFFDPEVNEVREIVHNDFVEKY